MEDAAAAHRQLRETVYRQAAVMRCATIMRCLCGAIRLAEMRAPGMPMGMCHDLLCLISCRSFGPKIPLYEINISGCMCKAQKMRQVMVRATSAGSRMSCCGSCRRSSMLCSAMVQPAMHGSPTSRTASSR